MTSYAEIVLATAAPTPRIRPSRNCSCRRNIVADVGALLATRRRRSPTETPRCGPRTGGGGRRLVGQLEFETDRARFLGRGRGLRDAVAVSTAAPLSEHGGTVLDPMFALRRRVRIRAGATARVAFWTMVAASRTEAAGSGRQASRRDRVRARGNARVDPGASAAASPGVNDRTRPACSSGSRATCSTAIRRCARRPTPCGAAAAGTSKLWAHGISGDLPIVLVRIDDVDELEIVRAAAAGPRILADEAAGGRSGDPQRAAAVLCRTCRTRSRRWCAPAAARRSSAGRRMRHVFILRADLISAERCGAACDGRASGAARAGAAALPISSSGSRCRAGRCRAARAPGAALGRGIPTPRRRRSSFQRPRRICRGRPRIRDDSRRRANRRRRRGSTSSRIPRSAFRSSAEGGGYTWAVNSRENQLTPWSNDPVSDRPGEVLYLRDEDTGELWGPTALPIRDDGATYVARHGQGYSRLRAHGARHRARAAAVRAARRRDQDVALDDSQSLAAVRGICR